MFSRSSVSLLGAEKRALESFDPTMYVTMNEPRLAGQLVFEYGVLANFVESWRGLKVLDIGSGRSRMPHWMAYRGAVVVTFDYPSTVEVPAGGAFGWLSAKLMRSAKTPPNSVRGDMTLLPFQNDVFDIVTSFSVIEHLDTNLRTRAYVPYEVQTRLARQSVAEMVRVLKPGGIFYLTSDCSDYARAKSDNWRSAYYYTEGPDLSGAWPVQDVPALFYDHLRLLNCCPVGPVSYDPAWLALTTDHSTFRSRYHSAFCVLACKGATPTPIHKDLGVI